MMSIDYILSLLLIDYIKGLHVEHKKYLLILVRLMIYTFNSGRIRKDWKVTLSNGLKSIFRSRSLIQLVLATVEN